MIYQDLNLPATLIHKVDGKQYTLDGKLLSVNESLKTAIMDFNGKIGKNIPLNEVYLNEGALKDLVAKTGKKLKDAAKNLWKKITGFVKSIGGLIVPVDENGNELRQFINAPFNWPLAPLPNTFKVIPSRTTIAFCEAHGGEIKNNYTVQEAFADDIAQDIKDIETYWSRVMREYAKPENESLTLSDTVKMVNETYYHNVFDNKALNETVSSLHSPNSEIYGEALGSKELVRRVVTNVKLQIMPVTPNERGRSILIWGAPGIGKTAILENAAELMAERFKLVLDMSVVSCSGLTFDGFDLPDTNRNYAGMKLATSSPMDWLPVYDTKGLSAARAKEVDDMYNNGTFRIRERMKSEITGNPEDDNVRATLDDMEIKEFFDGGILFFDEIARVGEPKTMNILMNLFTDRKFKNLKVASKWAIVAAANRLSDDNRSEFETTFNELWDEAKKNRFEHYTYVPTREEWLSWAREVNAITGRQNVDELICAFIESSPNYVWYDALDLGSRDIEGTDAVKQNMQLILTKLKDNEDLNTDELKQLGRYVSNPQSAISNISKVTWNGRTWKKFINEKIMNLLDEILGGDKEKFEACFKTDERERRILGGLRKETYTVKNLDKSALGKVLDSLTPEEWYVATDGYYEKIDKTERLRKHDRLGFFMALIGLVVSEQTGGENGKVYQAWDYYNKIESIMKPSDVRGIYMTGQPANINMAKEDNYIFPKNDLYANYSNIRWKSTSDMIDSICSIVLNAFDTYITSDQAITDFDQINRSLAKIEAGKVNFKPSKADIDSVIAKYSLHLVDPETKKLVVVPTLLSPEAKLDPEMVEKYVFILNNSKLAEYMANLALWISKISIQTGPTTPIDALLGLSDSIGKAAVVNKENSKIPNYTIMRRWSEVIRQKPEALDMYNDKAHKLPDYDLAKPAINILLIMKQYDRAQIFKKLN